jgi:capsular polysaccharide biosynthesis protein
MSAPSRILSGEDDSQAGRDQSVQDALATIWRRKETVFAWFCAALVVSVVALVLIPPRYTGEAIVRFNFESRDSGAGAKAQTITTLDPAALVDGAALIMRSRAVASAAVDRLGLDRDPRFNHESTPTRLFSAARSALGFQQAVSPSPRELAATTLLSQIAVTNEPRSYLITIDATAEDPKRAADLANAVAIEYLRSEVVERLKEAQAAAERDLDELGSTYGKLHPNYLRGQERVAQLQANLEAVRKDGDLAASLDSQIGPSFIPADVVAIPSSFNPRMVIGLGALAGLALGVWLSLRRAGAPVDEMRDELGAEPAKAGGSRDAEPRWALALPPRWSALIATAARANQDNGLRGATSPVAPERPRRR